MQYTAGEKKIIDRAWVRLIDYLERRPDCLHRAVEGYVKEEIRQSKGPSLKGFSRQEARLYVMRAVLAGIENPKRPTHELADMRPTLALASILGAAIANRDGPMYPMALHRVIDDLRSAVVAHAGAFRRYSEAVIRVASAGLCKAKGEE